MPVSQPFVPLGHGLAKVRPATLEPVAPHRATPFVAKMLQILGRIALGLLSFDGLLRNHAEVMDKCGARHGSGKSCLFRAPEEIGVLATAVHEPFGKKYDANEYFELNENEGVGQD